MFTSKPAQEAMSTFSLSNLHFLDDIGDIEKFSLSEKDAEKNASPAASQINESVYSSINTLPTTNTLPTANTLITNNTSPTNGHLDNSTSSSSSVEVEFDANLNVLADLEGSEPNSLRTTDYSENQTDPNLPYQSVFTLNTHDPRTQSDDERAVEANRFEFDFNETTFKQRPYRPKSAVKRPNADKEEEKKLNPIKITKKPSLLSHNFWTEFEQEVLHDQTDDRQLESDQTEDVEIDREKTNLIKDDDEQIDLNEIEGSQSLSSEKEENERFVQDDEDDEINEQASESVSADDLPNDNEATVNMFNELKTHINRLLDSKAGATQSESNDDRIIGELTEIRQIVDQTNVNRKLQQLKVELIDEFGRMLNGELKLQKERSRLEYGEFKLELENLEQQFNKQVKQIETRFVDLFDKSINELSKQHSANKRSEVDQHNELLNVISGRPTIDESQLSKLTDDLASKLESKLNLDELSNLIANLDNKFDLILNRTNEHRKSTKAMFSSDEESNDDETMNDKAHRSTDLTAKLDEIKLLMIELQENRKQTNQNSDDETRTEMNLPAETTTNNQLTDNKHLKKVDQQIDQVLDHTTLECDLCELANNIRTNIRSFRATFYRQKIRTYSKCMYTTNFLAKLDQQFRLGSIESRHNHSAYSDDQRTIDLEGRLNSRLKTYIQDTGKSVRESVQQLNQLGNYNFRPIQHQTDKSDLIKLDDNYRLKQIQAMRFNLNRRLIRLNQMIVNNY